MKFPTRHPSLNALWSSLLLEELWRLGVRNLCVAPGSRSAPLTLEAARLDKFKRHVHFDERGLGFFALGLAKASSKPVAVITTSGTAVANLFPAVIEARQSGVPLIIISADRPPELIDCGANQAIEQQGIYSGYPGATLNLPTPEEAVPASWLLTSVDQSFARSCQQGLPLHINCMFREPLYPESRDHDFSCYLTGISRWMQADEPHTVYERQPGVGFGRSPVAWETFADGKGVVVAGRIGVDEDVQGVVELAEALGWPLIADVQSQLHGHPRTLPHADLMLATAEGRELFRSTDRVFQVGGHIVSKRLERLLGNGQWQHYFMLGREFRRMDTGHCQTYRIVGPAGETCRIFARKSQQSKISAGQAARSDWLENFHQLSSKLKGFLSSQFNADQGLTESWIGANLGEYLVEGCNLFIGNSLPVRLIDLFSSSPLPRVFTNRGASGIDGLLATATGCAGGNQRPLVLMVGDLSFLHDLNSLQLARKLTTPMVILLLNNDGGGIFNLLPLDQSQESAREYFLTPHGLDAVHAAAMFKLPYHSPESREEFGQSLSEALEYNGCSLIEVKTAPGEAAAQISQAIRLAEELQ